MPSLAPCIGTTACRYGSNWRPAYFSQLPLKIKNLVRRVLSAFSGPARLRSAAVGEAATEVPGLRPPSGPQPDRSALRLGPPCCTGADVPEAGGFVHAADCPVSPGMVTRIASRLTVSGGAPAFGTFPVALSRHLRDELARDLAGAAEELAKASLTIGKHGPLACKECFFVAHRGVLSHTKSCRAGRVLSLVEKWRVEGAQGSGGEETGIRDQGSEEPAPIGVSVFPYRALTDAEMRAFDSLHPEEVETLAILRPEIHAGADAPGEPEDHEIEAWNERQSARVGIEALILFFLLLLPCSALFAQARPVFPPAQHALTPAQHGSVRVVPLALAGEYSGRMGPVHTRLHLRVTDQGDLVGTLDGDGVTGIKIARITTGYRALSFTVPALGASWAGMVEPDGTLAGIWHQGSQQQPLTMGRR